jgi:hypothetical protein
LKREFDTRNGLEFVPNSASTATTFLGRRGSKSTSFAAADQSTTALKWSFRAMDNSVRAAQVAQYLLTIVIF